MARAKESNLKTASSSDQSRIDELLDEPCANPRYGGFTLREAVRKVVLRRDDPVVDRSMHEPKDTNLGTQS